MSNNGEPPSHCPHDCPCDAPKQRLQSQQQPSRSIEEVIEDARIYEEKRRWPKC